VLVEAARRGHAVVRLKGGDPFVLGRGGEEAAACVAAGVPFEVVPGITSSIAAPAAAGIPVTHRGLAPAFAVVTGHEDPAKPGRQVDWAALAAFPGTLVVLMGMGSLADDRRQLVAHGRPASTPAAAIQWGTTAGSGSSRPRSASSPTPSPRRARLARHDRDRRRRRDAARARRRAGARRRRLTLPDPIPARSRPAPPGPSVPCQEHDVRHDPADPAAPRASFVAENPTQEFVLKRNSIERLKADKFPLDIVDELPAADRARLRGGPRGGHRPPQLVGADPRQAQARDLHGPHQGRRAGSSPRRSCAASADQPGVGRGLRRADHPPGAAAPPRAARRAPAVLEAVEATGLTTVGGEGDTVRNITGCPVAGIQPGEAFDVRPVIEEVAGFFWGNREYSNLPRKHKYGISACPGQCDAPEIQDVALFAVVHEGREGFAIKVGGGLSNLPAWPATSACSSRGTRSSRCCAPSPTSGSTTCATGSAGRRPASSS
jgi:hypothetical protein